MSEFLVTVSNPSTAISLSSRTEVESFVFNAMGNKELSDWYIACALNECYLNQFYKVSDLNGQSFNKFEQWAFEKFGYAKSTAMNFRNAFANCYEFKDGKITVRNDAFIGFTVSKVNEMNSLFTQKGFDFVVNAIESGDIKAGMTVKELRKAVKDLLSEVVVEQTAEEQTAEEQTAEEQTEEQTAEEQTAEEKTETKSDIVESIKTALNKTRMNDECRKFVFEQLEKLL